MRERGEELLDTQSAVMVVIMIDDKKQMVDDGLLLCARFDYGLHCL